MTSGGGVFQTTMLSVSKGELKNLVLLEICFTQIAEGLINLADALLGWFEKAACAHRW